MTTTPKPSDSAIALLPCPFCGSPAELEHDGDHHGEWFNLGCSQHFERVGAGDGCPGGRLWYTEPLENEAKAIAEWNRRNSVDRGECKWDEGSPCVKPRPAGMVYPPKPAPRASGYLDDSGVEWSAYDCSQMEAYARQAYEDGWNACRAIDDEQPAQGVPAVEALRNLVAEADRNPFNPIGHVIEHVVPESRNALTATPSTAGADDWLPMLTAPRDGTEIEILRRHASWYYADDERKQIWEGVVRSHWISFNGGGWVWSGIVGEALGWRHIASAPTAPAQEGKAS